MHHPCLTFHPPNSIHCHLDWVVKKGFHSVLHKQEKRKSVKVGPLAPSHRVTESLSDWVSEWVCVREKSCRVSFGIQVTYNASLFAVVGSFCSVSSLFSASSSVSTLDRRCRWMTHYAYKHVYKIRRKREFSCDSLFLKTDLNSAEQKPSVCQRIGLKCPSLSSSTCKIQNVTRKWPVPLLLLLPLCTFCLFFSTFLLRLLHLPPLLPVRTLPLPSDLAFTS